jgi:hypothetical protein
VIGLIRSIINRGEDIFVFQRGIIGENFFEQSSGSEQLKNVSHSDTLSTDAWAASTLAFFYCDPAKAFQVHKLDSAFENGAPWATILELSYC